MKISQLLLTDHFGLFHGGIRGESGPRIRPKMVAAQNDARHIEADARGLEAVAKIFLQSLG